MLEIAFFSNGFTGNIQNDKKFFQLRRQNKNKYLGKDRKESKS